MVSEVDVPHFSRFLSFLFSVVLFRDVRIQILPAAFI
jgi:hypothetical protein